MRTLLVLTISLALFAGCGDKAKKEKQPAQAAGEAAKPPAGLKPMGSPHAGGAPGMMPAGHGMGGEMPKLDTPSAPVGMDLTGITKAEGGYTISELFQQRTELATKAVKVRGRVVKFSPEIMGTNWVHVQDGTGETGANDLTVTTSDVMDVGDLVLLEGTLVVDQVMGHGMNYPVLVQDAKINIEKKD